ncbi:MAG TPA: hypothetical protein VK922_05100 [Gemmatimonadaceae bacterium]|nr:hypothetical protein [Gemmatimonadaceae bacterium]
MVGSSFSGVERAPSIQRRAFTRWIRLVTLLVAAVACAPDADLPDDAGPAPDSDSVAVAIDTTIAAAVAGEGGWNFVQRATADLDGDGTAEDVVLTARVEMYRGRPAWDDGQPWQVYIESAEGTRTYLYAQRLQLGTLTMRVSTSDPAGAATVILLEHLPDRLTVYEAAYVEGNPRVIVRFQRPLDPRGQLASPRLP